MLQLCRKCCAGRTPCGAQRSLRIAELWGHRWERGKDCSFLSATQPEHITVKWSLFAPAFHVCSVARAGLFLLCCPVGFQQLSYLDLAAGCPCAQQLLLPCIWPMGPALCPSCGWHSKI